MSLQPWALVGQFATVRFTVTADIDSGLLPRLLQPFARRDLTPDAFDYRRDGDAVRIEIGMARMPAEMVHLVRGNLEQTVGVHVVVCRQEITGSVRRAA